MKIKITCAAVAVKDSSFKDKDGKLVEFAVVTMAEENDNTFTLNTQNKELIVAIRKSKGKLVEWDFILVPQVLSGTYKLIFDPAWSFVTPN